MVKLPVELVERLPFPQAQALRRALGVIDEELKAVYASALRDHRPRDNAQIFGLRIWVHLWSVLNERQDELGGAKVVMENNTFFLRLGDLKIGIHKLGSSVEDDIHSCFPEGSPSQRAYGQRNSKQLSFFDAADDAPLPDERAYALRDLTVGHFGNSDDGLAKWYVGAYIYDEDGRPRWAWAELQETVAEPKPDVVPYSQKTPAEVVVPPRRSRPERSSSSETPPGA